MNLARRTWALDANGSTLVYSTFLGGTDTDFGGDVAIDADGNAYVAGGTLSPDFPTTPGAFDRTFAGGSAGFVAKVTPDGSALVYSTFLRGGGASAIAVDPAGNAWMTGGTSSADFPATPDAFDTSFNGSSDAVVLQLNASGSALLYSTFVGGANSEGGRAIALDVEGSVYVTGETHSADFPTTTGAFDRVWNGDPLIFWGDGFVLKFAGSGDPPPPPPTPEAPTLVGPADAAAPTQPVTLDWTDVTHATSYEVQVDNSSTIAAPFIANPTVVVSQASLGGLPAQQLWWRLRARNSAGVFGPFSITRRFTPQASGAAVTLTVTATGRSGERITSNPAGINVTVGSTGSADFTSGTSIRLSVASGRNAVWSGACSSGGNRTRSCTFTITGDASVTGNVR